MGAVHVSATVVLPGVALSPVGAEGAVGVAASAAGATPTKPASDAVATKPISDAVAAKQAVAIRRAKLAEHWQEWRYCLAPSQAEHKIYLSTAIPTSKIVGGSDAAFDRMLNTAGIFHDEVQCPRAPNKPTLLSRQRYAIRLNEEIGNAVSTLNWEPDFD